MRRLAPSSAFLYTVNNVAVAALVTTAGAGKNLVDHAAARAAIAEITATD
jgi:hypothetical protein